MSTPTLRIHLGRAVDHLLAATADLQAAMGDEPTLHDALAPVVLRLSTSTDRVDEVLQASDTQSTAPEPQGAA